MGFEDRKEMIKSFFESAEYVPMKFKELAGILQVPKAERDELLTIVNALVEEGVVKADSAGRYVRDGANIKQGTFQGTLKGFGFVLIPGEDDVFIPGDYVCGARDKDTVEVEITGDPTPKPGKRREGRIRKIIERGADTLVGVFIAKGDGSGYIEPDNRKFGSRVLISRTRTKGAVTGHKVVVKITDYGDGVDNAKGIVTEILGHVDDPGVDIMSVIRGNGIPVEFPPAVKQLVEKISGEVTPEDLTGRDDYRNLLTVTIDGEDAKDLDDAVTIERLENGFRLGVHIADVSNYVREGSVLDEEAKARGTSVYLIDRVIPMLPHELSNGICSLNAGSDRLTLSCVMDIDGSGVITAHKISESVINVDRRMSYTKVFEILDNVEKGVENTEEIAEYGEKYIEMFKDMLELSDIIRERRKRRGSLDFDFPESYIKLDEYGNPTEIGPFERNRAHMIIEDFMLAANETVAEEYYWLEAPFVYRSHEEPDNDKIRKLVTFLKNYGYNIHISGDEIHPKEIQMLLAKIEGSEEETLISRLTLRSMKQANYTTECKGHFGLAAKYYCHFTSPIRRYPDLQIHRIIKENLRAGLTPKRIEHYNAILPDIAMRSSKLERRADEAEREAEKMKKARYMFGFIGETFEGIISGVTNFGIYVELPNTIEGMIRLMDLNDDFYEYDEENFRVVGEHTHKEFKLGRKIKVLVSSVDEIVHTIDFLPA
jgi:ribonuclease R